MAVKLVRQRLRESLGGLYHASYVTERDDVPLRTDGEQARDYREHRHKMFGEQEGRCNGCQMEFPFRHFQVDHILPKSKGGTDHEQNLQLLCGPCNRLKGVDTMAHLMVRLKEIGRVA